MNDGRQSPVDRVWILEPDPDTGQPPTQAQLDQAMLECSAIIGKLGGVIQVGAQRARYDDPAGQLPPSYGPHTYRFQWVSFAPTVQTQPAPEPAPQPVPEGIQMVPVESNGHSTEPSAVPAPE